MDWTWVLEVEMGEETYYACICCSLFLIMNIIWQMPPLVPVTVISLLGQKGMWDCEQKKTFSFEFLLSGYFITTKEKEIKSPGKRNLPGWEGKNKFGWGGVCVCSVETQRMKSTHSVALSLTLQVAKDLRDHPIHDPRHGKDSLTATWEDRSSQTGMPDVFYVNQVAPGSR